MIQTAYVPRRLGRISLNMRPIDDGHRARADLWPGGTIPLVGLALATPRVEAAVGRIARRASSGVVVGRQCDDGNVDTSSAARRAIKPDANTCGSRSLPGRTNTRRVEWPNHRVQLPGVSLARRPFVNFNETHEPQLQSVAMRKLHVPRLHQSTLCDQLNVTSSGANTANVRIQQRNLSELPEMSRANV
jgi:hypothetical protein